MSTNLPASPILKAFMLEAENLSDRLITHIREHVATGRPFMGLTAIKGRLVASVDEHELVHFHGGGRCEALQHLSIEELISILIGFGPLT